MRKSVAERYAELLANEPTLYVVANRTEAVFYLDEDHRRFRFLDRLHNREGHLVEAELVSDRPGRSIGSAPGGVFRHSLDGHLTHHEQSARRFAKKIARQVNSARRGKKFHDLVLVAEPHFLGLLRNELDRDTQAVVRHTVGHEYARGSDEEIRALILKAIENGH